MTLLLTEIIGAVAGIATVFGLFGIAMYWLGKTNDRLDVLKEDVKGLKKDVNDLAIRLTADLLARDYLDKYIERQKQGNEK
ncbi:MAG: hypothetical protein WA667_24150 [Candidatus Nitrosopolaris sp.]